MMMRRRLLLPPHLTSPSAQLLPLYGSGFVVDSSFAIGASGRHFISSNGVKDHHQELPFIASQKEITRPREKQ